MKTTLVFAACLLALVIIQDVSGAREPFKPPKLGKRCNFNDKRFKKGQLVEEYPIYCKKIMCVPQSGSNFGVLELQTMDGCTCSATGKENYQRNPIKLKKRKCAYNNKYFKKNRVVVSDASHCFELVCKKVNKKGFLVPQTIDGCSCEGGHDDDFHWCYHGDCGPEFWADHFDLCGGSSQSPIDLVTSSATSASYGDFTFSDYGTTPSSMTLLNNGHTAQISIEGATPTITDGGLPSTYEFLQFHFHWGSEHTEDGVQFPLEVHFVHWNTAYGDVGTALGESDGLAVLGANFEIGSSDNPNYASILDALQDVTGAGNETFVSAPLALENYLPTDTSSFFRYDGSLTTPTCNEAVKWTVFTEKISISQSQVNLFLQLLTEGGYSIVDNFRPVQPLNGRTVYLSQ